MRAPRIKDLPAELRPRERLLRHGPDALSTAELVAVLLRTGSPARSALDVAADLIGRYGGLARLAAAGVRELCGTDGVGPVKALHLLAAFELGRRLGTLPARRRPRVSGPADAASVVMDRLRFAEVERFLVLLLNTRHEVLDAVEVTRGGLASSPVHPREVFKIAVREGAAAVILVHNHPSGDPTPSRADLAVTARLCRAAAVLGIPVLDHLIVGDGRWVSLRERMPRGWECGGADAHERGRGGPRREREAVEGSPFADA
ncbi:MAG TPA: DNA repair protein RadC [bacterium]|nr:DNA repair protein RadC [bacterium]